VSLDIFGRKKRRELRDREIMNLMAERAADTWPKLASSAELAAVSEKITESETQRLLDKATSIGYLVASGLGYYPGNARLVWKHKAVRCPSCGEVFPVKEWWRWGGGNDDVVFLYCDKDSTLVLFDTDDIPKKMLESSPKHLSDEYQRLLEDNLKPCPCGGRFRFRVPLLCPECSGTISGGYPGAEYYFVIDRVLKGERDPIWS
jgi:hypothetical protein